MRVKSLQINALRISPTNSPTFRAPKVVATEKSLFVEYYFLNPESGKFKRFRIYSGITGATKREKLASAKIISEDLLERIAKGFSPFAVRRGNETLFDCLKNYLEEVKAIRRKKTYQSYKSINKKLEDFLKRTGIGKLSPSELTREDLESYIRGIKKRGLSPLTVNNHILKLRLFVSYLEKRNLVRSNFAKEIEFVKEYRKTRLEVVSTEELETIKEKLSKDLPELLLFCSLVYYCFLRPGEICALKIKDFDFRAQTITVPGSVSKNGKNQTVINPQTLNERIRFFCEGVPVHFYLFGAGMKPGETKLHPNRPAKHWQRIIKEAGISSADLYSLKHRGAIDSLEAGINIRALQIQMRHYSLDETEIYLSSLTGANSKVFKSYEGGKF